MTTDQREMLVRTIALSYARNDLEPTSEATLKLYRTDAEHAADAVLAALPAQAVPDGLAALAPEMLAALRELHCLLDFEEPGSDDKPWIFEDWSSINDAFVKAYAVIVKARSVIAEEVKS